MTVYQSTSLAMRMEYDANNNAIYIAEASAGTEEFANSWRIKKITYDENNNATEIKWANGTARFDKNWNDRITYTYK